MSNVWVSVYDMFEEDTEYQGKQVQKVVKFILKKQTEEVQNRE